VRFTPALLFAWCALTWGQQYRWVDERGRVQYSDVPPPASARNVQRKNLGGSGRQQAMQAPAVTLYTAPNCELPCRDARRVLEDRGIPFTEISVPDEVPLAELKRATGAERIPALLVGSEALVGLSVKTWNAALDSAGYGQAGAAARPKALPPVSLYTNSECGAPCAEARSYLQTLRVPFSEVSVDEPAAVAKLQDLTGQQKVPVLTVGKVVQRGYEMGLYARLLGDAGYPVGSK